MQHAMPRRLIISKPSRINGYQKGEEGVASEAAGISIVPKPVTSIAAARGLFDKADFAYDAKMDVYVWPACENLSNRPTRR